MIDLDAFLVNQIKYNRKHIFIKYSNLMYFCELIILMFLKSVETNDRFPEGDNNSC